MRGENKRPYSAATIVDEEGTAHYHVIPTRLVTIGIACVALLMLIAVILGVLVVTNKWEIYDLQEKIKVEENK